MARIQPNQTPAPEAQEKLDALKAKLGSVPNIFQTFAHSPAVLNFYLAQSQALAKTAISGALREQIALTVAGQNGCDYCASAHTVMAKGQGIEEGEAANNLKGQASDAKVQAALDFVKKIVASRANLADADIEAVREAGYSESDILEIVAVTCMNIFTNYFNHIVDTDVDFPHVSTADIQKAA